MIDRKQLLDDLKSFLKTLEADLLARSESDEVPEVRAALTAEFETAKKAERTALNYEDWRSAYITQMAAAWVLTCVFTRFIEDNQLVESPMIAGPGDRLEHARNDHQVYFTNHPTETDREYLIHVFDTLRDLGGGAVQDVFGPHNVLRQLPNWLSGDAAGDLLEFFRKIDPNTGQIVHDFTDPDWNTRFLGDLYQDLSESARKKYALLQTPDFVEEFILDRTLEPALDEFGLQPESAENNLFKMIDPACGSGHFLLGSFPRILKCWQEKEPGTNKRDLVQRTLDSIHGVDINPFAIAIARFRLLLTSLQASGITRLADAPAFAMNLACGDSLYHGVAKQQTMDFTDEAHYFKTEDAEELRRILQEGTFHAVVANPPYITPKDDAANKAYRRVYPIVCHKEYSLAAPFMQRLLGLSTAGSINRAAGFIGQITANSFMTNEFGKPLVEKYLVEVELTHIIDTRYLTFDGHGTPTVILFARNRKPNIPTVRTVMGIKGATGGDGDTLVWTEILNSVDAVGAEGDFVSTVDKPREVLSSHPWSIGGGGLSELKTQLDFNGAKKFRSVTKDIGYTCITKEDEFFVQPLGALRRKAAEQKHIKPIGTGEEIRDWHEEIWCEWVVFPYSELDLSTVPRQAIPCISEMLWPFRTKLGARKVFGGQTYREAGKPWHEFGQIPVDRFLKQRAIVFAYKATHNHYVYNRVGKLFSRPAPVIKFNNSTSESEQLAYLALFNSSINAFWEGEVHRQVSGEGLERWQVRLERNCTKLKEFPLPTCLPEQMGKKVNQLASEWNSLEPQALIETGVQNLRLSLTAAWESWARASVKMIRLQEDLDWECYRLYGLLEDDLTYPTEELLGIQLGERAFEIVLARKMARGEVQTTWFERHGSTPITELPDHWPDDYKQLLQRRIDVIESNPQIALIEQPEYKRRWNTTPWEEQVEKALNSWLLDRLESYFDFDDRMLVQPNDEGSSGETAPVKHKLYGTLGDAESPRLVSVAQLADLAAQDEQFMEVAEVYKDDPAFDVQRLVEDLVKPEQVPLLPILRYKPAGLRKRAEWEKTWDLQRLEDAARAGTSMSDPAVTRLIQRCEIKPDTTQQIEAWQQRTPETERSDTTLPSARELDAILSIPVPPKYKSSDMISTGGAKYWKLRGKLDVPKERWISFPHCEGTDGTLMLAWAGYDHLQVARAISGHYIDVRDNIGGTDDARLVPLLAGIIELLPWLHQWHSEIDPEFDMRMNEYYETFVTTGAADAGLSREDITAWEPPAKVRKKKATKKKPKEKQQELDV